MIKGHHDLCPDLAARYRRWPRRSASGAWCGSRKCLYRVRSSPVALHALVGEGIIPQAGLFDRAQGDQGRLFVPHGSMVVGEGLPDGLEFISTCRLSFIQCLAMTP